MHLIIPSLIPQPTWGGFYISELKDWSEDQRLKSLKIGQSFELSGHSLLATQVTDSSSTGFDFCIADTAGKILSAPKQKHLPLSDVVKQDPQMILGPSIAKKYHNIMPLLIKLNQAAGNSFQLHIKPGEKHERWVAKPESWYFLENGTITCGIKKDIDIAKYKESCLQIEQFMKKISAQIQKGDLSLEEGRSRASTFIKSVNPWQFVNTYNVEKGSLIDLSAGAVTHSWEENAQNKLGNVIYEVQLDVADDRCTIRSFDQGKIKDDGTIREIHIEDYFRFIETGEKENDIRSLKKNSLDDPNLKTPYYQMDIQHYDKTQTEYLQDSYQHLYVRDGAIRISDDHKRLTIHRGHSCFIPFNTKKYTVEPLTGGATVLRSHQPL